MEVSPHNPAAGNSEAEIAAASEAISANTAFLLARSAKKPTMRAHGCAVSPNVEKVGTAGNVNGGFAGGV